jgi:branched-chain amino acid transport system substrate-binding protein
LIGSLALLGCDVFNDALSDRVLGVGGECVAHADCGGTAEAPIACVKPGRCVPLLSDDCKQLTGDLSTPDALVLGSLFSLSGSQAATNLPRQRSVMMAVEQINQVGGVPAPGAAKRKIALVSCNEADNLRRAADHLVTELKVPAIIGPNTSQDTIDLSHYASVAGGTLLLSPTAVASSIADLDDDDLTWMMVPSDAQRAPLMIHQIDQLAGELSGQRGERPIKLSIVHRSDALGTGTRAELKSLMLNGKTLLQNQTASPSTVLIDPYDHTVADQQALVARQRMFEPDIIVIAGLAEAVTNVMQPLEQAWTGEHRPHYVLIDSLKVPELLAAAMADDGLRQRIRGTGVVPTPRSKPVFEVFRVDYQARFPDSPSTISGMGPAYDATYAIAYALAATRDLPVSGKSIAEGLRKLSGGTMGYELLSTKILAAYHDLTTGRAIDAVGTFAPLSWNARGAPIGNLVEIWCIGPGPSFQSSGLTYDLAQQVPVGSYQPCGAQ